MPPTGTPLVRISPVTDVQLFGVNPYRYHVTSLFPSIPSSLLLHFFIANISPPFFVLNRIAILGDTKQATRDYGKIIRINPKYAVATYYNCNRGSACATLGVITWL